MQTTKLISSISFNTPSFLRGKLQTLVASAVIEYGYAIIHHPEDDETKEHIHFIVKPNRRLDTSALRNEFVEKLPNEEKARGCLPFRATNHITDWLLYSVHDVEYLLKRGETRKHHYNLPDIWSTCQELLEEDWRDCHRYSDSKIPLLAQYAKEGKTWFEIVSLGFIPVNQLFQYKEIFFTLIQGLTDRNGREGHE